jgi:hypothetical protein
MKHVKPNIRPEVAEFIARMSEEEILCRAFGHKWDPETSDVIASTYEIGLKCERCETERDKVTERATGYGLPNRYRYGQYYSTMHGVGFLTRQERTLINKAAAEIIRQRSLPKRKLPARTSSPQGARVTPIFKAPRSA